MPLTPAAVHVSCPPRYIVSRCCSNAENTSGPLPEASKSERSAAGGTDQRGKTSPAVALLKQTLPSGKTAGAAGVAELPGE